MIMRKIALLTMVVILSALLAGCAGGEEVDQTPPVISGVGASGITISTTTITWTTNEWATSEVEYGLTTSYGSTAFPMLPALVTNHSVTLSDLAAGTTYHFRVKSKDASENEATSGDFTFTTESLPIAYIYYTDATGANSYRSLLEDSDYSVTLVPMIAVATTDFSTYALIIVGGDTGYTTTWGDTASVAAVTDSGKLVIGLGEGGYAYFGKLALETGYPHGGHYSAGYKSINVVEPSHTVFNAPSAIVIPPSNSIQLYTSDETVVEIYLPSILPNVVMLGQREDSVYYPVTIEDNMYLLWGFTASPESMTQVGKDLFLNVVDFLI
jgi:hypothetical protein